MLKANDDVMVTTYHVASMEKSGGNEKMFSHHICSASVGIRSSCDHQIL